ncbi:MAG: hypothetical protein ABW069_10160 [Duganella sp.]
MLTAATPASAAAHLARMPLKQGVQLFGTGAHAVPVPLYRAPGARLLWLNQRAMLDDPAFHALGGDVAAYGAHLLAACAMTLPAGPCQHGPDATGYADRYGGVGISTNGGSGRAALVNGYLVKGIGRTPLVGETVDAMHGSGGAYLEECLRETIFSEVVGAEFPHSAIPTLALIDTGMIQHWDDTATHWDDTVDVPAAERRVLLVRACFVRPAHLERAAGFHSPNPKEGALDFKRVQHMFAELTRLLGAERLAAQCARFARHWAEQLAYAYVHRLSPSGNSTSNICLDGALLDFGACAALPSWAQIMMIPGSPATGNELQTLEQAVHSLCYHFGRSLDPAFGEPAMYEAIVAEARAAYARTLAVEMLRSCGIPRHLAQQGVDGPLRGAIDGAVASVLARYRKERFDIYACTPEPKVTPDLHHVWDDAPPPHLVRLRAVLDALACDAGAARSKSGFLVRPRAALYREEMKTVLHRLLAAGPQQGQSEQDFISGLICSTVASGRRDARNDMPDAVACGFAVAPRFSLALYRCRATGALFAAIEWAAGGMFAAARPVDAPSPHASRAGCLAIAGWDARGIALAGAAPVRFECFVAIHAEDVAP